MRHWEATRRKLSAKVNGVRDILADVGTQVRVLGKFVRKSASVVYREDEPPRMPNELSKRLLVISHYSPPYRSAFGTQRLAKYIKYLDRWGWHITLVTTEPGSANERDEEAEQFSDSVRVIRLPQKQLRSWRSPKLMLPDDFVAWVEPAVEASNEVLARESFDCIFATVPPYSNAVAATICASTSGVPFVPDFRDPWSRISHGWDFRSPLLRNATAALEQRAIRASSRVVMADRMAQADMFFPPLGEEYRRRVESIQNGYDDEDFAGWETMRVRQSSKFVVSYIGSIYDEATLRALMEPLEEWRRRYPKEFEDVVFDYAGPGSRLFDKYNLRTSYLRDQGFLPHLRAIEVKARCTVQLFCLPAHMSPHVLSGKIYEMIRSGIPIVAIVRPDSDVVALINETKTGVTVEFGKPGQTMEALRRFYTDWRDGKDIIEPDWPTIERYSRERLARQLEKVIIDAALRRPPSSQSHQTAPDRARDLAPHAAG